MKKAILLLLMTIVSFQLQAQKKKKNVKYTIDVKGNCEMCKHRIEKASLNVEGVKYANWNVQTKKLSLILNEKKADIKEVEKNIAKAGHDTKNVKAPKEAYNNLNSCCQYRD